MNSKLSESSASSSIPKDEADRREFLSSATSLALAGGLAASYGTFAYMAGKFMYASGNQARAWVFVTQLARMKEGDSLAFRAPTGERIAIARQGTGGSVDDFVALSSTCPHLGCQVNWEAQNKRFFCPCHNGVFDAQGKGISGPPGDAGQVLPRYPLRVEGGLLFIEVPAPGEQTASLGPHEDAHEGCGHTHAQAKPGELA